MHLETVTPQMLDIAKALYPRIDGEYYLSGGTALALHIGHRVSIDLDYFLQDHIDVPKLKSLLNEIFPSDNVSFLFEEKDTLWCTIDGVKVSFISRLDPLIKPGAPGEHFRLASLEDITVMKLAAVVGREEYKDYFDLACLVAVTDVRSWITWWGKVSPQSDPISFIVALAAVDMIPKVPIDAKENFKGIDVVANVKKAVLEIQKFIN